MSGDKQAKEPAKNPAKDRGEPIGLMEPMLISEGSSRRGALRGQTALGCVRRFPRPRLSASFSLASGRVQIAFLGAVGEGRQV
ncbi:MAG: hypothetical protein EPO23_06510 [Xanthobacteraceae bacterium]|nr:MAG: hypothetical protein EPO23_06510 [Xanthobacteraceae bacterium]